MRRLTPLLLALLAGCATEPPVPLEVKVQQVSNIDVCRAVFYAPAHVAAISRDEASRRGINCSDYAAMIMQQDQANAQARAAAAAAFMARPAPQFQPLHPIQAPQPINCSSYRIGNTVQTNCN